MSDDAVDAPGFASVAELRAALAAERYLADDGLATALFVALALGSPLLLEGEAGVGKTELAKALAAATDARLIRLQCHEGIDVHQALYDWDYERQLLTIRRAQTPGEEPVPDAGGDLYDRRFLLARPLLEAIESDEPTVLLIDELDRADIDKHSPSRAVMSCANMRSNAVIVRVRWRSRGWRRPLSTVRWRWNPRSI